MAEVLDVGNVCGLRHPEDTVRHDGEERLCVRPVGHPPLLPVIYVAGLGNYYEGDVTYVVTRDRELARLVVEAVALEDIRDRNHAEAGVWTERVAPFPGELGWALRRWELMLAGDDHAYVEERELM